MSDAIYPKGYKAKPDNEKTDADWEIHEALMDWMQTAFNAHWYECSKFLDASRGGKQTSNELHLLCQGYALAAARITELETALAEVEGRVIADVVKWLRGQHIEIRAMRSPVRNLDDVATALETGEWKK